MDVGHSWVGDCEWTGVAGGHAQVRHQDVVDGFFARLVAPQVARPKTR